MEVNDDEEQSCSKKLLIIFGESLGTDLCHVLSGNGRNLETRIVAALEQKQFLQSDQQINDTEAQHMKLGCNEVGLCDGTRNNFLVFFKYI